MEQQIFRQKSIERISSPEQLHDYIRVTSPRLWMLLAAIIVLITGLIIAASTFRMENTREIPAVVEREEKGEQPGMWISISLPPEQKDLISVGMKARVGGEQAKVTFLFEDAEGLKAILELDDPEKLLPEGNYTAEIVLEESTPISFLLN